MTTNTNQGPVRGRFASIAMVAVFDVAGPLVAYQLLRSAGQSAVTALVLSGILPAVGVGINLVRRRRIDAIGILVLAGIAVGTILGLLTHDARLVLLEGSVPTAMFGLACIGSLWTARPLIYRFAVEFMGEQSQAGRAFAARWQYEGFRHAMRLLTVVWGIGYLLEAVARVIIVETTSTGTALTISKFMPFAVAGALALWSNAYRARAQRRQAALAGAQPVAAPAGRHRRPLETAAHAS